MKTKITTLLIVPFLAMMVFTGCDVIQSNADKPQNSVSSPEVHIQMKVASTGQVSAKTGSINMAELNDLEINEIKLFVEEMKLKSIENDSLDFEIENAIVKLPLDGSPLILAHHQIPVGVYHEFEIEIEKPDDDDVTVDDADFRDETGSYSVVVKGLYQGEAFMFRSSEDFEIDIEMYSPLEVSESGNSLVVVSINVESWFKGPNGEVLDPTDMNTAELINKNIEWSFEAEEEKFEERDFEGMVQSVNSEAGTFTLENGMKFLVTVFTEIDDEDFATLQEVVDALAQGVFVEAEGEYYTNSDGVNVVIDVEFEALDEDELEVEESDFAGLVQSVNTETGTFTLDNGLKLTLNDDSEIEDEDFVTLEEVMDALAQGILVESEGEFYTNSDGANIVVEVEFVAGDDDMDDDEVEEVDDDEDDNDDDDEVDEDNDDDEVDED